MTKSEISILIGNGPNRLSESSFSWEDVLDRLSQYAKRQSDLTNKPFTILFEELVLGLARTGTGNAGDLKRHLASLMRSLEPNSIHRGIMGLELTNVLTTNYDYSLEQTRGAIQDNELQPVRESKFSLFRSRMGGKTRVWHIHGELSVPRSIMLGFDHYVAYLGRLHAYVSGLEGNGPASPFIRGVDKFDVAEQPYSWVDLFLRNELHVVGLSLLFEEIHLWWLLMVKERLRYKRAVRQGHISVGRTVFYHIEEDDVSLDVRSRLSLLEALGVEIVPIRIEGNWEYVKAYHFILDLISRARTRGRSHAARVRKAM